VRIWGAAHTDRGLVRAENQDAYGVFPEVGLFVVADGVGGQSFGREASLLTVESIRDGVLDASDDDLTPVTDTEGRISLAARQLLLALEEANRRVIRAGEARGGERMGSTVVAVLLDLSNQLLAIAHVGDARAYRIRGAEAEQLTADHTLVQRLIEEGRLTREDAENSPQRHLITQAIGSEAAIAPSMRLESIVPGDRFVLCSDGVHDVVRAPEIGAVVAKWGNAIEDACRDLVALANARGGRDNSTVVIVGCGETVPESRV
jgi:protein phosphatase